MDLYLVLDLSISITQNVDYHRSSKVQRALCFAETLIKEIDKNEVTVHLVSYLPMVVVIAFRFILLVIPYWLSVASRIRL